MSIVELVIGLSLLPLVLGADVPADFEVFSAFGTVGLSLGITPQLSKAGKVIIILTMYIGRIGLLTFLYAFSLRRAHGRFSYVEEAVMIG